MLYILTVMMFLINIKIGNSRRGYLLMLLFLFLLLAGSYGAYDTMIYYRRYEEYESFASFTEPLFTILVTALNMIGVSAQQFMAMTAIVAIIGIDKFLTLYSKNNSFFFFLFIIFPMITFFTQLRYLLAISFVLAFAFPAIISKGKKGVYQYIIVTLFATGFHTGAIAFLVFLPVLFLNTMQVMIFSIVLTFLLFNISFIAKLLLFVQRFISLEKLEMLTRVLENDGQWGRVLFTFLLSATMLSVLLYFKHCAHRQNLQLKGTTNDELLEFMIKINMIAFIFVPLVLCVSIGFYRVPLTLLLLNYVVIGNLVKSDLSSVKISRAIGGLATIIFVIGLFYSQYSSQEMMELAFIPFYEENLYLSLI